MNSDLPIIVIIFSQESAIVIRASLTSNIYFPINLPNVAPKVPEIPTGKLPRALRQSGTGLEIGSGLTTSTVFVLKHPPDDGVQPPTTNMNSETNKNYSIRIRIISPRKVREGTLVKYS